MKQIIASVFVGNNMKQIIASVFLHVILYYWKYQFLFNLLRF